MNVLIVASVAVSLVCFILYALDRKSKNEEINYSQAFKMSTLGGLITSGVVFAVTSDMSSVAEIVSAIPAEAQEMFVGTPSF
jgi:hypothetical protein